MNNSVSLWRDSWKPVSDLRHEFDRIFEDWSTPTHGLRTEPSFVPACDVEEAENHYLLSIEMPGMKKDEIKLEIHDGQLMIAGERRQATKQKQEGQWYSERRYGKFQRSFTLPPGIDAEKVEATYEDGLLQILVPKAENAKPKQVKISSGGSKFPGKLLSPAKDVENEQKSAAS